MPEEHDDDDGWQIGEPAAAKAHPRPQITQSRFSWQYAYRRLQFICFIYIYRDNILRRASDLSLLTPHPPERESE